jgi:hypothetical protein
VQGKVSTCEKTIEEHLARIEQLEFAVASGEEVLARKDTELNALQTKQSDLLAQLADNTLVESLQTKLATAK